MLVYESESNEDDLVKLDREDDDANGVSYLSFHVDSRLGEKEARKRKAEFFRRKYLQNLKQTGLELELVRIKNNFISIFIRSLNSVNKQGCGEK